MNRSLDFNLSLTASFAISSYFSPWSAASITQRACVDARLGGNTYCSSCGTYRVQWLYTPVVLAPVTACLAALHTTSGLELANTWSFMQGSLLLVLVLVTNRDEGLKFANFTRFKHCDAVSTGFG